MSDEQQTPDEPQANERPTPDAAERAGEAAERLGRAFGRFARGARDAANERRPELERRAREAGRQAQAAARAARPHVEQAAEAARPRIERAAKEAASRTARFAREHDDELRQAANVGATVATSRLGPPFLRPVITAVSHEVTRPRPPRVDPMSPPPPATDDAGTGAPERPE